MVMQKTKNYKNDAIKGGRYARTEEELYEKAIALLDKCKIEPQHPGQELPELRPAT